MTDSRNPPEKSRTFSIRFYFTELAALKKLAGSQPVGTYVRKCALREWVEPRKRKYKRKPNRVEKLLAQILSALGQTRMASNLNQIARAINSGSAQFTPETEALIQEACRAIIEIRNMLLRALKIYERNRDDT